ncbi:MAG TPA: hypothetical protein VM290_00065 [Gaiellaceae bacterium]|nr:hypothetical protein [Gaiellaceae bacterium]
MRRLAVLLALVVAASGAGASRGVAVDVGRIDVEQKLTPGGSYSLPMIGVRNPGTERSSYVLAASPVEDPERKAPPAEWFEFEPSEVTLGAGETERVRVRLTLPRDAEPGDYITLDGAQLVNEGGGAQVGAAAAARTTFTVEPASLLQAWWLWLKRILGDLMPWSAVVPAVLAGGALLWFGARRFEFRVARKA